MGSAWCWTYSMGFWELDTDAFQRALNIWHLNTSAYGGMRSKFSVHEVCNSAQELPAAQNGDVHAESFIPFTFYFILVQPLGLFACVKEEKCRETWVKALPALPQAQHGRSTRKERRRSHLQLKVCEYFTNKKGLGELKRKYLEVNIYEATIFCKGKWYVGNAMISWLLPSTLIGINTYRFAFEMFGTFFEK